MAKPPSSELNWSPRARPLGQLAQVLKLVARMDGALWIQPMSDGSDIDPVGRDSTEILQLSDSEVSKPSISEIHLGIS